MDVVMCIFLIPLIDIHFFALTGCGRPPRGPRAVRSKSKS